VVLDNATDSQEFAKMLLKMAENCTTNLPVQQYVFTRIEEVLGLGIDSSDKDREAFGIKHARLFTTDGKKLADNAFVRAINFSDIYLQRSASMAFACLLTATDGNVQALINWINSKLVSTSNGVWDMALPALGMLSRGQNVRSQLLKGGVIQHIVNILNRIGVNGNPQHIYELIFVLWTLSLGETDLSVFLSSGAIPLIVDFLAAAPSRKVTRMIMGTLRNLATTEDAKVISEMLTAGLMRLLENISGSNALKQMGDIDVENDFRVLSDSIHKNFRELTTFDKYASEVRSGALRYEHGVFRFEIVM
jgi:V-type H+-transporting ATPase subunit H